MEAFAALLPDGVPAGVALLLIAASALTSALTASFGVGGGLAMLALLGVFLPIASVIPVHGVVQLGSNSGRTWHQRTHVRWDIAAPFMAGSVFGAIVGVFLVVQLPDALLKLLLGGFILFLTWGRIPGIERINRVGLMLVSGLLAVISMLVGATGPLVSVLLARFLANDRKALVATHAAAMIAQHGLKTVVFVIVGFAFAAWLPLIAAMILSGYLGTIYGSKLLDRMPEERFRFWFRIAISLLALDLVRRGIAGYV